MLEYSSKTHMSNHITMTGSAPQQAKSGVLTIDTGTHTSYLPEGVIPPGVSDLIIRGSAPTFSAQAITGIENLMVADLTVGMSFPWTLKRLFIASYTGSVPLPHLPGGDVFVSTYDQNKVSPGSEHYIWLLSSCYSTEHAFSTKSYVVVGSTDTIKVFGQSYGITKRVPRSESVLPAPVLHFKLDIGSDTLRPEQVGSIKELSLTGSAPKFEAETIAGLEALVISDLNKGMAFPETLKWLIIESYSGRVPLPKVQNVCVHAERSKHIKTEIEHSIFYFRNSAVPVKDNDLFECVGEPQQIVVCGDTYSIRKRVPKALLVPAPVIAPVLSDQAVHAEILKMLKGLQEAVASLSQILRQTGEQD